jgi:hypothetical protein
MDGRIAYLGVAMNDLMRLSILRTCVLLPSIPISNSRQDTQSTTVLLTPVFPTFHSKRIILATHPKPQKLVHSPTPDYLMAPFR